MQLKLSNEKKLIIDNNVSNGCTFVLPNNSRTHNSVLDLTDAGHIASHLKFSIGQSFIVITDPISSLNTDGTA